ncbi:MAG: leucine-rich repeat domain-containing protein [Muribaculaceae bacterium]|nr:leucine-rich repeat domain-containing protein [Muribaculaceae bacterium]
MKKQLLKCLASAALGLIALPMSAEFIITPEGILYDLDATTQTASLFQLSSAFTNTDLVVPDVITKNDVEYKVTSIAASGCRNKTSLTSVTLGENVATVGENAFYGCTSVTKLSLPSSLRTIGQMAFYGMKSLSTVTLPEGIEEIGNFAFYNSSSIGKVVLPSTVTKLGGNPWGGCTSLSSIEVAEGNTCFTAVDGVLFDIDVTRLIAAPCLSVSLMNYTVPSTVKIIGNNSMRNNTLLRNITLPEGLETIESGAFYRDSQLSAITLPSTVSFIGSDVFTGCTRISKFAVDEANENYTAIDNCLFSKDCKNLIAAAGTIKEFNAPDALETIGNGAFYQTSIATVNLNNVKTVGESAFEECKSLSTVDFGTALENIGSNAFQGCVIVNVKFPKTLRTIGTQAFMNNRKMETLELNEGLTTIGKTAFGACEMLGALTIPGSVKVTGQNSFYQCLELSDLTLEEGIEEISGYTFGYCPCLETVELPSTVKTIGTYAFGHSGLSTIKLSESLKEIGTSAFYDTFLREIELTDAVETVAMFAFGYNNYLTSFKAGKGLRTLDRNAIYVCPELVSVELNEGLESIGEAAIAFCDKLTTIEIPSTVTSIGLNAFNSDSALETLVNKAEIPQTLPSDIFEEKAFDGYATVKLIVPSASVDAYKSAEIWKKFATIQAESTSGIEDIDSNIPYVIDSYGINGMRQSNNSRGLRIEHMSDGSVRKVFVK